MVLESIIKIEFSFEAKEWKGRSLKFPVQAMPNKPREGRLYRELVLRERGWRSRRSAQAQAQTQACPSWPQTHREGKRSGAGLRLTS